MLTPAHIFFNHLPPTSVAIRRPPPKRGPPSLSLTTRLALFPSRGRSRPVFLSFHPPATGTGLHSRDKQSRRSSPASRDPDPDSDPRPASRVHLEQKQSFSTSFFIRPSSAHRHRFQSVSQTSRSSTSTTRPSRRPTPLDASSPPPLGSSSLLATPTLPGILAWSQLQPSRCGSPRPGREATAYLHTPSRHDESRSSAGWAADAGISGTGTGGGHGPGWQIP